VSFVAYFDTNVFDNLIKKTGDLTEADEFAVRSWVSSGQLSIAVSPINIQETFAAFRRRPEVAITQLLLMRSLCDWDRLAKHSTSILKDDVDHFAFNGERSNTPYEDSRQAAHVRSMLQQIIDGQIRIEKLEPVIDEDRDHKSGFLVMVKEAKAAIAAQLEGLEALGDIPTFQEFFEENAGEYVRAFVETFSSGEACKQRGLDGLMKIPSVRALIGVGMSFMYRINAEKRSPKSSAERDFRASAERRKPASRRGSCWPRGFLDCPCDRGSQPPYCLPPTSSGASPQGWKSRWR